MVDKHAPMKGLAVAAVFAMLAAAHHGFNGLDGQVVGLAAGFR